MLCSKFWLLSSPCCFLPNHWNFYFLWLETMSMHPMGVRGWCCASWPWWVCGCFRSKPALGAVALCCTSLHCSLALSTGWGQLPDLSIWYLLPSVQRAGRMRWRFHGVCNPLAPHKAKFSCALTMSMELTPSYIDAGKLWPLQLISNCNPRRRMVG